MTTTEYDTSRLSDGHTSRCSLFHSSHLRLGMVATLVFLWFFNLGHVKLTEPDEGRYAEIAREMAATHDYITPRLNGFKYFEKPPLQYWATASFYHLFGESEWTARLWTSLTSALTVLAIFLFAFSMAGEIRAWLAATILLSSPLFVVLGHLNTLDMGLSLFLTLMLLSAAHLIQENLQSKHKIIFNLLFWTTAALAILSKGLVSLILPGATMLAYMAIRRNLTFLRNLNWWWGPILFLAIAAPWHILVSQRNPEFFQFYFVHEHFERFLTKTHDRTGPPWYFVPILLGGFFPWSFISLGLLTRTFWNKRNRPQESKANSPIAKVTPSRGNGAPSPSKEQNVRLLLLLWSGIVFLFFSVSSSKLPPYILPIIPALALLAAEIIEFSISYALRWLWGTIGAITALSIWAYPYLQSQEAKYTANEAYRNYASSVAIAAFSMLVPALLVYASRKRASLHLQIVALSILIFLYFQNLTWGFEAFAPSRSGYDTAQSIRKYLATETVANLPIYSIRNYVQTVPFYLKRPITLVEYTGELDFGQALEPKKSLNYGDFIEKWQSEPMAVAIFTPYDFRKLNLDDLQMKVIFQDRRRFVVVKTTANKTETQATNKKE